MTTRRLFALLIAVAAGLVITAALGTTPPSPTVKRLQTQVTTLRFQLRYSRRMNDQLTNKIHALLDHIHQLESDITDCVSKIPPPVGP